MKEMINRVTAALCHSPEDTLPAKAAIRAVFEHLRDNALPLQVRLALDEATDDMDGEIFDSDQFEAFEGEGERIFLAGVEKILEGLK